MHTARGDYFLRTGAKKNIGSPRAVRFAQRSTFAQALEAAAFATGAPVVVR